jgi:bacterioferritin-associated ferredoxin
VYVCSCFGITEEQVRAHAEAGVCTPRQMASASKAGTDCGSCVRRIQGLLGRGGCPRRTGLEQSEPALAPATAGPGPAPVTAAASATVATAAAAATASAAA